MDYEAIKREIQRHFFCDAQTGTVYRKISSNRKAAGAPIGHRMKNGYLALTIPGLRVKVYCHHIVYFLCTGKWGPEHGIQIDHRDCCRHNNALENLREASASLNCVNSYLPSGASAYSTAKGVRYRAQLMIGGERYAKAGFMSAEDANAWYLTEKRTRSAQFFGEVVGA